MSLIMLVPRQEGCLCFPHPAHWLASLRTHLLQKPILDQSQQRGHLGHNSVRLCHICELFVFFFCFVLFLQQTHSPSWSPLLQAIIEALLGSNHFTCILILNIHPALRDLKVTNNKHKQKQNLELPKCNSAWNTVSIVLRSNSYS